MRAHQCIDNIDMRPLMYFGDANRSAHQEMALLGNFRPKYDEIYSKEGDFEAHPSDWEGSNGSGLV